MLKPLLCMSICGAATLYGQTSGVLTGRIIAEQNQQSLTASITIVTSGRGVRLQSVATDERGMFSIQTSIGTAVVIARADGYASEEKAVVVRPGRGNPHLTFSLSPTAALSGRVVDEAGAGVAGARVWLHYRGEPRAWRFAEESGGHAVDASGAFTIDAVAQGKPFVLYAESDGWLLSATQPMMLRSSELRGVLLLMSRRGGSVSGHVRDVSGRPVAGARVHLRTIPADSEFTVEQRQSMAFARSANRFAISLQDGSYSFAGLPGGRIVVTAQLQDRRAAAEAESASGRQSTIDLILP